ncbi:hypothetical protein [Neobacillus mesonae]|nr:hypothetical protein [Neobacillus mesonae]
MKRRRKIPPRVPVEEFSIEYGDVNGVPLVETKNRNMKNTAKRKK